MGRLVDILTALKSSKKLTYIFMTILGLAGSFKTTYRLDPTVTLFDGLCHDRKGLGSCCF